MARTMPAETESLGGERSVKLQRKSVSEGAADPRPYSSGSVVNSSG